MLDPNLAHRAEELVRAGQYNSAEVLLSQLIGSDRGNYGLRVNHAQCLKRLGRWHEAIQEFQSAFQIRRSGARSEKAVRSSDRRLKGFYVHGLIEQVDYLQSIGVVDLPADDRSNLERLWRFLRDAYGANGHGEVPAALLGPVADLVEGCAHFADENGACVRINPSAQVRPVDLAAGSPIYVVDDFLDPETLAALRCFLHRSTIWYDARPERGYLGAHLHDGLGCALVENIAHAVREFVSKLIGEAQISQVWAFKYSPIAKGIDWHADQASWNVNIWITDEKYNNAPETGGMTISGCTAPADWTFEMYNASPDAVRAYIEGSGTTFERIAYRGNRAVVFDSRLFHKTDPVDFSHEYEGRRINMTVMVDRKK